MLMQRRAKLDDRGRHAAGKSFYDYQVSFICFQGQLEREQIITQTQTFIAIIAQLHILPLTRSQDERYQAQMQQEFNESDLGRKLAVISR